MTQPTPYPQRLPVPAPAARRKQAWRAATLAALLALGAGLVLALAEEAAAGEIPADGPRLFGRVMPDKTFLGLWTYAIQGSYEYLADDSLLQGDSIHVIVYAPLSEPSDRDITLTFTWQRLVEVTNRTAVEGGVSTRTSEEWETVLTRSYDVEASPSRILDTAIELPTQKEARRLVITYENRTVATMTHQTSPILVRTPRELVQDEWVDAAWVLGIALVAAAGGIAASRWIYQRAGNYVPAISGKAWALGVPVAGALLGWAWFERREELIMGGSVLPLFLFAIVVCFFSLQTWRTNPQSYLFIRVVGTMDATQPQMRIWSQQVPPPGTDIGRLSTDPNDHPIIEGSWKATFWRILGARSYARFPADCHWHYEITGNPDYARAYLVTQDLVAGETPRLFWERPPGALLPRLKFQRLSITEIPVSPWASDKAVMRVLANIISQQEVAEEHQRLLVRNAELEAALRSGRGKSAQQLLDQVLLAMRAIRTGQPFDLTLEEHKILNAAADARPRMPNASYDGPGGTTGANGPATAPPGESADSRRTPA